MENYDVKVPKGQINYNTVAGSIGLATDFLDDCSVVGIASHNATRIRLLHVTNWKKNKNLLQRIARLRC